MKPDIRDVSELTVERADKWLWWCGNGYIRQSNNSVQSRWAVMGILDIHHALRNRQGKVYPCRNGEPWSPVSWDEVDGVVAQVEPVQPTPERGNSRERLRDLRDACMKWKPHHSAGDSLAAMLAYDEDAEHAASGLVNAASVMKPDDFIVTEDLRIVMLDRILESRGLPTDAGVEKIEEWLRDGVWAWICDGFVDGVRNRTAYVIYGPDDRQPWLAARQINTLTLFDLIRWDRATDAQRAEALKLRK